MTIILKGKEIKEKIKKDILKTKEEKNITPILAVLRIGSQGSDLFYERSLMKNCESLGIGFRVMSFPREASTQEVIRGMEKLNQDKEVSGILVFRPLPKHIDEKLVRLSIRPDKDVDAMHPMNLERIFEGDLTFVLPATPKAVMRFLDYYQIPVFGKKVLIVNRSLVFGKPLAMMLLEKDATPILAHSKTENLEKLAKDADVVVLATGKGKMFGKEYFHSGSIILDVGISTDDDGKLCGDADYDLLRGYVRAITPSTGGIGSITTILLLEQLVNLA